MWNRAIKAVRQSVSGLGNRVWRRGSLREVTLAFIQTNFEAVMAAAQSWDAPAIPGQGEEGQRQERPHLIRRVGRAIRRALPGGK